MIYNTLHSRYTSIDPEKEYVNNPKPDWGNIEWPKDRVDYECGTSSALNGMGMRFEVPTSKLFWNPPPINEASDNVLTGWVDDGNLCAIHYQENGGTMDEFEKYCPSQRCFMTGRNVSEDGSMMEACCAWDLPLFMGDDDDDKSTTTSKEEDIHIPAYFITMSDAEKLNTVLLDSLDSSNLESQGSINYISVVPYAKWYPNFHYSTLVLWVMAVFTVWISCYMSASEYRTSWKVIVQALEEGLLVLSSRSVVAPSPMFGEVRGRVDTDETVDLAEDVLEEVEMTGVHENGNGEVPMVGDANTHDLNFRIDDDLDGEGDGETKTAVTTDDSTPSVQTASPDASTDAVIASNTEPITNETEEPMVTVDTNEASPEGVSNTPSQSHESPQTQPVNPGTLPTAAERHVELNAMHAVAFVICASAVLLLLFFFNLFKIVTFVYGLGGSACMSLIVVQPLLAKVLPEKHAERGVPFLKYFGYYRVKDVLSSLISYSIGLAWVIIAFTHVNPLQNTFYWVIQDVLGVCYCIYVMSIIHINTIMVGTILLVLVFFYDVFYVFLSPYIFGTSVMVDVATGGIAQGEALNCYKYPSDHKCSGSQAPLPMMLVFPWVLDYRGGFSMIGLGDIVLPGLLISFASRYDGAKFLTRKVSEMSSSSSGNANEENGDGSAAASEDMEYIPTVNRKQALVNGMKDFFKNMKKGYFGPMMVAYAVGLSAAYAAVYGMERGQPALLYIVPACLGTMFVLGKRKRQLSDLWQGPKVMLKANRVVMLANKIPQLRAAAATSPRNNLPESTVV